MQIIYEPGSRDLAIMDEQGHITATGKQAVKIICKALGIKADKQLCYEILNSYIADQTQN